jgi:hypothetical protein
MKTRTENKKQQNQVTDTLNVQPDANDLAKYGEWTSPATKKNVIRTSCKVPDIFIGFNKIWGFSINFHNFSVSSFTDISPVRAALIHANSDGHDKPNSRF